MSLVITPKYDGESFEKMFRRFKNKVKSDDRINEIKKFEYYEKPSERKRRKKIEAKRSRR